MSVARFFIISRPAMWVWLAGPYIVGIGSIHNFTPLSLAELFFLLFPLNFFLYGINDIYDRKSDEINPRKGDIQGAVLKEDEVNKVKWIAGISAILFLLLAATAQGLEHLLFAFIFIMAGLLYSHPPIRFKEIPFLDSTVGGPIVYLTTALIAFSLHGSALDLPPQIFLLALPFVGFHAVSTLKDERYDKEAGMRNTGIFLGRRNTLLFAFILTLVPLIYFTFTKDLFLISLLGTTTASIALVAFTKLKTGDEYILSLATIFVFGYVVSLLYYFLQMNL